MNKKCFYIFCTFIGEVLWDRLSNYDDNDLTNTYVLMQKYKLKHIYLNWSTSYPT